MATTTMMEQPCASLPRVGLMALMGKRALSGTVCILQMPCNAHAATNAQAMSQATMARSHATAAANTHTMAAAGTEPATPCSLRQPAKPPQRKVFTESATTIQLVFAAMPAASATR
eukprot:CAMPEP_0179335136 /NCGR_PEP_ID=MMETSP0797-20121207/66327_1 /TAXON_ID=47934 /ORGANISM="Dinophysis acuminata, Strain DAEP01" /LENGTH=115 /DNA_ID=CAMNT_0021048493 /DNA_START=9 /DNA_END=353 /DNA_ORIENTATION=+